MVYRAASSLSPMVAHVGGITLHGIGARGGGTCAYPTFHVDGPEESKGARPHSESSKDDASAIFASTAIRSR
jgi:hypothetical protein